MKNKMVLSLILMASLTLVASPGAFAARNPGKALKGVRNVVRNSARRSRSPLSGSSLSRHLGNARRSNSPFSGSSLSRRLGNSGRSSRSSNSLKGLGNLSRSHRDWPSSFYPHSSSYRREDSMARAYRDVGLAHAMVGLVGVMASMSQEPVYPVYAPAPTAVPVAVPLAAPTAVPLTSVSSVPVVSPAPSGGYWERRPVVVHPQHYEKYEEWIPPITDARTGETRGGGYFETRSRLVPERVEYQDVWVPQ
ncbi:MAG: hypothetical protein GX130_14570 [Candidatus Hydrogenedens sp.]|nr:hypothetical protein [Candidatus Hydrogenedens sp.]